MRFDASLSSFKDGVLSLGIDGFFLMIEGPAGPLGKESPRLWGFGEHKWREHCGRGAGVENRALKPPPPPNPPRAQRGSRWKMVGELRFKEWLVRWINALGPKGRVRVDREGPSHCWKDTNLLGLFGLGSQDCSPTPIPPQAHWSLVLGSLGNWWEM